MSNELARINTVRDMMIKHKDALFSAIPKHLTADRLIRVACTELQRNPKLAECDQRSLIGCIVEASQMGWEIGARLGHAYLVPFKQTCQLIPGYKGLADLARRSGQVSTIQTQVVYEKDEFDYCYGLETRLVHRPTEDENTGPVKYAYAIIKLRDGGVQYDVMTRREIEAIRARSRSANNGPWVTDWNEMAKKTVLRRTCKLAPVSIEMQRAVALDEEDDRYRRAVNYGAELPLPLPQVSFEIDGDPEPTTEQAPTGGTTQQVAERIQKKRADKKPQESAPPVEVLPAANGPSVYKNLLDYIEGLSELADCEIAWKEVGDAVAAGQVDADQAQTLKNKWEIRATILRAQN